MESPKLSLLFFSLFCFVLMMFLSFPVVAEPEKPNFSQFYDPNITTISIDRRKINGVSYMNFSYDQINKQKVQQYSYQQDGITYNETDWYYKGHYYYEVNGLCRNYLIHHFNATFGSYVPWLKRASYVGVVVENGTEYDYWLFKNSYTKYELFVYTNGIPFKIIVTEIEFKETTVTLFSDQFEFGISNPNVFKPATICLTDGIICPGNSTQTMTAYNYMPKGDYNLKNVNVADLLGDVVFVCYSLGSFDFTVVSKWELLVNTSWGQYAFCNYGECDGGNPAKVGREGAFGYGDIGGQCTSNADVGSWYSLPKECYCSDNQSIGDDGCQWKIVQMVKTISAKCLRFHGFVKACNTNTTIPYQNAVNIFNQAFLSDDINEGGCPNIAPNTTSNGFDSYQSNFQQNNNQRKTMIGIKETIKMINKNKNQMKMKMKMNGI